MLSLHRMTAVGNGMGGLGGGVFVVGSWEGGETAERWLVYCPRGFSAVSTGCKETGGNASGPNRSVTLTADAVSALQPPRSFAYRPAVINDGVMTALVTYMLPVHSCCVSLMGEIEIYFSCEAGAIN